MSISGIRVNSARNLPAGCYDWTANDAILTEAFKTLDMGPSRSTHIRSVCDSNLKCRGHRAVHISSINTLFFTNIVFRERVMQEELPHLPVYS